MKLSQNCKARGVAVDLDAVIRLRDERNKLIVAGDELRRRAKGNVVEDPQSLRRRTACSSSKTGKQLRTEISETEVSPEGQVEARTARTPGSDPQHDTPRRSGGR